MIVAQNKMHQKKPKQAPGINYSAVNYKILSVLQTMKRRAKFSNILDFTKLYTLNFTPCIFSGLY